MIEPNDHNYKFLMNFLFHFQYFHSIIKPLNGNPAELRVGVVFIVSVINAKKSRVILLGFF